MHGCEPPIGSLCSNTVCSLLYLINFGRRMHALLVFDTPIIAAIEGGEALVSHYCHHCHILILISIVFLSLYIMANESTRIERRKRRVRWRGTNEKRKGHCSVPKRTRAGPRIIHWEKEETRNWERLYVSLLAQPPDLSDPIMIPYGTYYQYYMYNVI